ncbi:sensor histidine kinase [Nocardioides jiangxiensis]|uniref:histidine kinase n=1 Tax=Nocardioides jiangxiensis TaxID=3064524 RepID=A0ABT9AYY3_9ACTN|nr:histidine kinase dimerization/phospho-acceptor domain-containing protein [Nocardioides sp. WY-20]MDO7867637.1 histidine kinase dimerization/phospho-acceptor domain-containing protein [Nocardioides sp. WY-20]
MAASSDAERVAELDRLDALSPTGEDLQELVALAARVLGVPKVAINLISADEQHQVAAHGFDPAICSRSDSMCAAVLAEPAPVVVPDARSDERFAANPFVTGEIGEVRFYASAPLVTLRGVHIGRLCAFDDVPHEELASPEMLAVLADRVVDLLELRAQARELARTRARLTSFVTQVNHDLRNPLSALLANVELLESEPALAEDASLEELVTGARRSGERISTLLDELTPPPGA